MYKILVLMSTYNGEKYIESQLNSILTQEGVETLILIRDDYSSDITCKILEHYKNENNIIWYRGDNLGAAKSFLHLCLNAKKYVDFDNIDYVALSDQDDIWDKNKLYIAASALKENNDASLYCCSLNAFSENDKDESHIFIPEAYGLMESLIRNSAAGCTMVFTKELLTRLNYYQPSEVIMHDAWIMQICIALGMSIIIDSNPHIQYRLHSDNQCGAAISVKQKIAVHMRRIWGNSYATASITAHELLAGYKYCMQKEYIEMLEAFDKSEKVLHRRWKLLMLALNEHFSNTYRKAVIIMEIVIGRV